MNRVEAFVADIEAAPEALARFLHGPSFRAGAWRAVPRRMATIKRLRFIGLGSSRFAALGVAARLRAAGLDAAAELASAPTLPKADDATALVAISRSGSTAEVVDTARAWRDAGGWVVAVTNRPDSPLGAVAAAVLDLNAGNERSGIATRTYRHSIAALTLLAESHRSVGVEDLLPAVGGLRELMDGRGAWLPVAADVLDGDGHVHVVGGSDSIGAIEQAALMFREAPRIPALAMDAGDWLHVGLYTMLPGGRMLFLGGTPYDDEVVRVVRGRGGRVVAVGSNAAADLAIPLPSAAGRAPLVRALVEPAIAELIAAELWRRTTAADR